MSGTWAATPWWLDQLGLLALHGHEVQCRQTLAGADYGLLTEGSLDPTPDYWASLLWRRTMGNRAYAVALPAGTPPTVRVYCHSARPGSIDGGGGAAGTPDAHRTFLLINLGRCDRRFLLQAVPSTEPHRPATDSTPGGAGSPHRSRPHASPAPRHRMPAAAAAAEGPTQRAVTGLGARGSVAEPEPKVLFSEEGGLHAELAPAACRVLCTYLLNAPSLSSRTVLINNARPVAHHDGTSDPFLPAHALPSGVDRKGGGLTRQGEVLVPACAVLFAVVACEPDSMPHAA